jgi:hypothetical protein
MLHLKELVETRVPVSPLSSTVTRNLEVLQLKELERCRKIETPAGCWRYWNLDAMLTRMIIHEFGFFARAK